MDHIHIYCEQDQVSIWWEPQPMLITFQGYTFTPEKNHIEFNALIPDTEYTIQCNEESYTFHTLRRKERIDITKEPYLIQENVLCTKQLQQAILDCDENHQLYIPQGTYLTGALDLHSNLDFYLEEGAILFGSEEPEDYEPRILSRFEGTERYCYRSLLNLGTLDHTSGPNCSNVLIHGKGEIRGGGFPLAKKCAAIEKENVRAYMESHPEVVASCENENTIPFRCRGRLINMSNCSHVRITGLTLGYGPSWNIHFVYSTDIVTDHCFIQSVGVWNGDGWDPDSSENCVLYACDFETEDDSAAIKSGKNPQGNEINRPTKNIRIFDCHSKFGHGICIGSEMSGGVEDVWIHECDMERCECGIEIKATKKRGGYVKNIRVTNTITSRIQIHAVGFNDDGISAKQMPVLENFTYDHDHITGIYLGADHAWHECTPIFIHGFDEEHPVQNVLLKELKIEHHDGFIDKDIQYCKNLEEKDEWKPNV